jgi:DNA-binding transcriptional ArsR family regulator
MKGEGLVKRVCRYNKAISDTNRMKMIKIIGSHEPNTMNVSAIAETLGITQPAATKHLKIMEATGIIARKRVGNSVYYALDHDAIAEYQDSMAYAFAHCATPCAYGFDCDNCPVKETCM